MSQNSSFILTSVGVADVIDVVSVMEWRTVPQWSVWMSTSATCIQFALMASTMFSIAEQPINSPLRTYPGPYSVLACPA